MARGSVAKNWITEKICETFGDKVVQIDGSKIYINAPENGEIVQVALAMTCPKTPVGPAIENSINFAEYAAPAAVPAAPAPAAEITAEEQANIQSLLEKLGL